MIREIRKIGDPVLRKKANKVEKITKDTLRLLDDMVETMRSVRGLGLAAPQVGVSLRAVVIEIAQPPVGDAPPALKVYYLINPEIVKRFEETDDAPEGCLSIPGWRGEVTRNSRVVVKALDRSGERIKFEADGVLARALQHEVDHLDGVLYIDKLVAPDRVWRVNEDDDGEDA
jgi:peptide deformylase